ncbi:MAG: DUF2062 domain-containing protein [Leptospirales bacterium]
MITPGASFQSWKKRLSELVMNDPDPKKVAMAIALGFCAAFLPPFGFHTILVMMIGYVLGISVPLAVLGTWINNPWTFIPLFLPAYVLEIKLGGFLLHKKVYFPALGAISRMPYKAALAHLKPVFWPFILGSMVFSAGIFIVSFFSVYGFLKYRKGLPPSSS